MLFTFAAAALAFAGPMRAPSARSTAQMTLSDMPGASIEIPFNKGRPWDPLGLSKLNALPVSPSRPSANPSLKWLREAELKHGRVCMLVRAPPHSPRPPVARAPSRLTRTPRA